jgi:signal transduction histidine kinase|tara:strand:+ start:56 stop:784 length:729 start_codon:yes stop_codon:yes gene_type:complete
MQEEKDLFTALSKMSALLAHEMRNPLTAAMGQAELLLSVLPDGHVRDKIHSIFTELNRLNRMSESLLDFIGSRQVERAENELAELIFELEALIDDPRLVILHERKPARWWFDTTMLACAVKNIAANALAFSDPEMPVEVTIAQDGDVLSIAVRDFGEGFPEDIDIFEPFVTTQFQGTGLGMAISSEIVEAHGGVIEAEDHPDGGAIVTIRIPGLEQAPELQTRDDVWHESSLPKMRTTSVTS